MELNEQGKLRIDFLLRLVYLIGMIFIIRAVSFDAWNKSMEKEVKCIFSNLSFLGDRIQASIFDLLTLFFLYNFMAILFSFGFEVLPRLLFFYDSLAIISLYKLYNLFIFLSDFLYFCRLYLCISLHSLSMLNTLNPYT